MLRLQESAMDHARMKTTMSKGAIDMIMDNADLQQAAQILSRQIGMIRDSFGDDNGKRTRLRAHLGCARGASFETNLDISVFSQILGMLESFPRWSKVTSWEETQDVFYVANIPTGAQDKGDKGDVQKTLVKTGMTVDGNSFALKHTTTAKVFSVAFGTHALNTGSCMLATDRENLTYPLDIKAEAVVVHDINSDLLPIAVDPQQVRIKQKKRFFLKSLGLEDDIFVFQVLITYSGTKKRDAEQKQKNQKDGHHEVSVECLDCNGYLRSCGGEELTLALSVLMKLFDFVSALNHDHALALLPIPGSEDQGT